MLRCRSLRQPKGKPGKRRSVRTHAAGGLWDTGVVKRALDGGPGDLLNASPAAVRMQPPQAP